MAVVWLRMAAVAALAAVPGTTTQLTTAGAETDNSGEGKLSTTTTRWLQQMNVSIDKLLCVRLYNYNV